jgi:two-component system LytT family response regulator
LAGILLINQIMKLGCEKNASANRLTVLNESQALGEISEIRFGPLTKQPDTRLNHVSDGDEMANEQLKIQALIIDDEPLARKRIRDLLKDDAEIELAGECSTGSEAIALLEKIKPSLVFLDIQMPETDGFELMEIMNTNGVRPAVIFVTAYDKYALRAFDAQAVDYLLKPFSESRFRRAVQRAKHQIQQGSGGLISTQLLALLREARPGKKYSDRLVIRSGGRALFLRSDEIDYIEAAGNYLTLHVGKENHLIRETMQNFEARLDPERFLRIHRSTIVNIERIKEFQPWFAGEYVVVLRDGRKLTLSRTYRPRVQQFLGK